LAASLLTSDVQVPEACVPAAAGRVVPAGTAGGVIVVDATVSSGVTIAGGVDVVGKVQPAVSIITMTTAHRNTR